MKTLKHMAAWFFLLALAAFTSVNSSREIRVTGQVVDDRDGSAIRGAHVVVKGTTRGTLTDETGKYEITAPSSQSILVFSHSGYGNKEVVIGNRQILNVRLVGLQLLSDMEDLIMAEQEYDLSVSPAQAGSAAPSYSKRVKLRASGAVVGSGYTNITNEYNVIHNTEEYDVIQETGFLGTVVNPLSTFSIDVDAASYSNLRRVINNGGKPARDMVRIEEMVNYFTYDYRDPKGEHPFSITTEVSRAPWNTQHQLVHIGLQGKKLDYENLKPNNLVFLIDASGSMSATNKLPLLKSSLKLLLNELSEKDRVAIVAYAGAAGLVLPSTPASQKATIINALDNLSAGGSTAGGAGIELAYKVAIDNLIEEGNNRVILATDGDFNVGISSTSDLVRMIEEKRKAGVYLTITGFGMGNYKDGRMEQISNAGNGNYFYIDNIKEARKVFVTEMRATLFTIAKDVKIQVEFNPSKVQAYRLLGYENRMLKAEDFNDDLKDAGELGAGHTVTALYEIIPTDVKSDFVKEVDALKYQETDFSRKSKASDLLTVKFRYKKPDEDRSRLITEVLEDVEIDLDQTSDNFRWSAAVAEFGMLLRESEYKGNSHFNQVLTLALGAQGKDPEGYRSEFIDLVRSNALLAQK